MMQNIKSNNRGIALVMSMIMTMLLLTFGSILLSRTFFHKNTLDRQRNITKAFYLAEAGAQAGLYRLDRIINTYLLNTINNTKPDSLTYKISQYVSEKKGLDFLIEYSIDGGVPQLSETNAQAVHRGVEVALNEGMYQYVIRIRQKGAPLIIAAEIWDFPYYFTVESIGRVKDSIHKVSASGTFTVRVQHVSFSKAILFKNADFKNQSDEKAYIASSGDLTKKITWQENQL